MGLRTGIGITIGKRLETFRINFDLYESHIVDFGLGLTGLEFGIEFAILDLGRKLSGSVTVLPSYHKMDDEGSGRGGRVEELTRWKNG